MKRFSCIAFACAVAVACGGTTAAVANDGGATGDAGTDSGTPGDAAPRPSVESLQTCSAKGSCVLGAKGCCGLGCQPDGELIAIRRGTDADLVTATCDDPGRVACPKCARLPGGNIQAFCTNGKCNVVDVRKDPLSACSIDDDCVLRYGTCCQACNGGIVDSLVALNKSLVTAFEKEICAGNEGCDKCLPIFPPGSKAKCDLGHCQVVKP